MIMASKEYDEESAKEWFNTIINERIESEEIAERRRQEEIQITELKRQEEISERKRQEEIELRKLEYEERKRKDEMEFELQKIRLGAEGRSLNTNSVANQNVNSMQIKPREGDETGHKIINCVTKETNQSSDESLSIRLVGENSDESNSFLKKAKINNCANVQALIDTGSSCCLLKISIAQKLKLKLERAVNKIYGFGNQKMPALTSIGRIKVDIEVDNVKAENIIIYVVPDDAQSVDLIIGRTWLDLPHIAYTKTGNRVHIGYHEMNYLETFRLMKR
ncbi:hypothetical protein AVEN_62720-1 [Araneus ventricosus]|uniref:Peptidase A2 domain-containing protein n=1 Tax=Araneus ventricosus TaxID=182803 RepID=A0A4Y2KYW0_ARAVE|nr:hypothetical protein AVEN_62720-1 [Araneus ventricosus]